MKILLPTDGSRYALAAARALTGWFAWRGGRVDILAVSPPEPKSDHRDFGKDTPSERDWRSTVDRWVEEAATHLDGSGLRVDRLVRSGDPAAVAVEVAADGYDLVAVGAKGRGEAPFLGPGSVALALLERAPTSVLLVREREPSGRRHRLPTPQRPLRTLLAVDGRPPSQEAARAYSELVAPEHVEPVVLAVADAVAGGPLAEPDARDVVGRVASMLEDRGIGSESRIGTGSAADEILAAGSEADLIVIGSRASREPGEIRVGSVGLEVARSAPCSVLLVREEAPTAVAEVEEEPEAATPVEIAYENMEPSAAVERHVRRGLRRLERVAPDMIRVRVTLAQPSGRHRTGNLYDVHLEIELPGPNVAVSRTPPRHGQSEDVVTAIGEAFEKARRQLVEQHRVERGQVKIHEPAGRGQVSDLFPDYGFIRSSDGRIVYFHRNSVVGDAWDELEAGSDVRFVDEPGDEGPQATTVTVLRRRHTIV